MRLISLSKVFSSVGLLNGLAGGSKTPVDDESEISKKKLRVGGGRAVRAELRARKLPIASISYDIVWFLSVWVD